MYKIVNKVVNFYNERSKTIILTPNYKSFGNCSEEIFYGILKAERENKKLLLVYPKIPFFRSIINLINEELFFLNHERIVKNSIWLDFLRYSCGIYLVCLFFLNLFNRFFFKDRYEFFGAKAIPSCGKNSLWLPKDALTFNLEEANQQNWIRQYSNFHPPTIDKEKEFFALSQLRKLGLPIDAWFVCLHVPQTKDRLNIRQSSIDNYLLAIKYITDQGGWVIRIGDPNNPELPELDNVIDYAHNQENYSIVNLYAISKCKFFIGVTSGPSLVASLFRVFVVGTNRTQLAHDYAFNLSIIKHVYDKNLKKYLSIEEILEASSETQFFEDKADSRFQLSENTEDEIKHIVEEAYQSKPSTQLMKTFDIEIKKTVKRFIMEEGYPRQFEATDPREMYIYRYRAYAESPICLTNSYLSHGFLERNWKKSSFELK